MTLPVTFAEACRDPALFGPWFEGASWDNWRVMHKALFGEPLFDDELTVFRDLTARDEAPTEAASEAWLVIGRRGGKDVNASAVAVYLATIGAELYGYRKRLTRGERGVVQILAVDRDQAKVCLGYIKAFFEQPMLAPMVKNPTAESIELTNGIAIEVTTNDKRRVRGRTVIAAIFDEAAYWRSENSVNPDEETYRAVKPAMATIPGAMLIVISSPYAQRGLVYKKFRAHWGKPGKVLVVKAPTWVMNPTLPRDGEFLSEAFQEDPAGASAEYGAEFRSDVETFVPREVVEGCVTAGVFEREPNRESTYVAFVDPSGGSSDSMTMGIAHREGNRGILDCIRERKAPFSPESVVAEFAETLKEYGVSRIVGDRYSGEWCREAFRRHGIEYVPAEKPKSQIYIDVLPLLNSGAVELLDSERLVLQFVALERRTTRGGRDTVDHPPGGKDDLANSVAGVLDLCSKKREARPAVIGTYGIDGWDGSSSGDRRSTSSMFVGSTYINDRNSRKKWRR
jgi:hypothetical protein